MSIKGLVMGSGLLGVSLFVGCISPLGVHFLRAKEAERDGRVEDAVREYKLHMAERLEDDGRPDDENPYLYDIFIGDLYLKQDDVEKALEYYRMAQDAKVYEEFIVDRYRQVAQWYEERGEYQKAIDFLKEHRDLDIDLFDLDIDRLHKLQINRELREDGSTHLGETPREDSK